MHPLVENAKATLGIRDERPTRVVYSRRFSAYNGNIRATQREVVVGLSKDWQGRDPDVVQGLIEQLLGRLFKKKMKTPRMALYQDFLLYVHREQKTKTVEGTALQASYERVMKKYFSGTFEMPNLTWGQDSVRKLGHYHYGSDTILLSTILRTDERMLDRVMYHELLHKKHGMTSGGRAHTKAFYADEALFTDASEEDLTRFVSKHRRGWRRWF